MHVITPLSHLGDAAFPSDAPLHPCVHEGHTLGAFYLPGSATILDVHTRTRAAMERGRVLLLYLDGLGYSLYTRAVLPFIKRTFACVSARTVYPPLTQPCMASMLTGVWPQVHGIFSRRQHVPRVPSLLSLPGAVLIEGDCAPLALEKDPILTLPREGEDTDDAVFRAALPFVKGDAPLVIVHFHGLDDWAHDVGDDVCALAPKLLQLDNHVQALCDAFHGTIILCADHGVHKEGDGGAHGLFDYRDMFIPLGEVTR